MALLPALLALACSKPVELDQTGAEVIAAAKIVTGGEAWDDIAVWHESGRVIMASGETLRYEHWADFHSLKSRAESIGKSESHYSLFDGQRAYASSNANFSPRVELDAHAMKYGAYIASFGFFFAERFPASFQFRGTRTEHSIVYDIVDVSPAGLEAVEIWVDQNSHLIFRVVSGGINTDFSDYRQVGGVTMPFTAAVGGDTMQTQFVAFEPAGAAKFSLPAEH